MSKRTKFQENIPVGKKYSKSEQAKAFVKGESLASLVWTVPVYLLKQWVRKVFKRESVNR